MNQDPQARQEYWMEKNKEMLALGWFPLNNQGTFFRNGKTYDLSAANLSMLEEIEKKSLFRKHA